MKYIKRLAFAICLLAIFTLFSACVATIQKVAQPLPKVQTPTSKEVGFMGWPNGYTFEPHSCADFYEADTATTSSSEIAVSWNRDSIGSTAQIDYVRPSADVTNGGIYFVFCNQSPEAVTVPAGADVMYSVLN